MLHTDPPPFFHRGPSPLARLSFFALLSIALLFADTRFRYLEGIRYGVTTVIAPLQRAVQWPAEAASYVASYFASKRELSAENTALKNLLLMQGPALQGASRVEVENRKLKALLDVHSQHATAASVAVEVLFSGRDPFSQKVFVGKGVDAGIKPGEAVIDESGVVGQVTRAFASMSEVTLLTDKDHAVPVKNARTGVRSVLYGAGTGRPLELRFIPPSADVQVGDRLVTSGLDGIYPAGLAVARVDTVERDTGQIFAAIGCSPLAGVDRSEQLLVLGETATMPPRPDEPAGTDAARKPVRGKGRRGG
ncbi:MAG TPA: rod shape-determining protein MreC [Casimicrobiaceae bacterium]